MADPTPVGHPALRLADLRPADLVRITYRDHPDGPEVTVTGRFNHRSDTVIHLVRSSDGALYQVQARNVTGMEVITPDQLTVEDARLGPRGEPFVFAHTPLSVVFYGAYGAGYSWRGDPSAPRPSVADMPLVDRAVLRALAVDIIAELDRAEP